MHKHYALKPPILSIFSQTPPRSPPSQPSPPALLGELEIKLREKRRPPWGVLPEASSPLPIRPHPQATGHEATPPLPRPAPPPPPLASRKHSPEWRQKMNEKSLSLLFL